MATFDETTLRRMYLEEQHSIRAIAEALGYSQRTIYDALMRWRIPRRSPGVQRSNIPPTFSFEEAALRKLYLEEGHTIKEIAAQYRIGESTVWSALNYWHIPRRRRGPRPARLLAEVLA
jgi:transposase